MTVGGTGGRGEGINVAYVGKLKFLLGQKRGFCCCMWGFGGCIPGALGGGGDKWVFCTIWGVWYVKGGGGWYKTGDSLSLWYKAG